jgi:antitoxin PrlF
LQIRKEARVEVFEATVTSKGQVTLPVRLRTALGLKTGDKLVFQRGDDGAVRVEALTDTLSSVRGIVRAAPQPVDGKSIARWIEESRRARWRSR